MDKVCSTCDVSMELSRENFEPRKNSKDGFRNQCRKCRNEMRKNRYIYKDNYFWTEEEVDLLKEFYPIMSAKEIHYKFLQSRSHQKISDYAIKKLKLKKIDDYSSTWTKEQIGFLKGNYENLDISVDEISETIGKNKPSVISMANNLNLYRHVWSSTEKQLVFEYYSNISVEELISKHLHNKTREQVIRFANKNGLQKTYEFKKNVAINNLKNINENQTKTLPEKIVEELLIKLNIGYENQHFNKYYWIDFYLPNNNLFIEVQGDYFHCRPNKEFKYNVLNKNKIISKDKRKHSYFKNNCNSEILYLWEDDLVNNPSLCEKIISEYVQSNGSLNDYHSFNYTYVNNELKIIEDIICIGY